MKTVSINVQTLCVPCENRCRYCLLSYDGKLIGADYERSEAYAKRFHDWLQKNRPDLSFQFFFGYSMEHPKLLEAIDFMKSIGSAGGEFLQFDGLKFRTPSEIDALLRSLKEHGIRLIDLTFYGQEEYHDRFAARKGDFGLMLAYLRHANRIGLDVSADIPLSHENAAQAEDLIAELEQYELKNLFCFVPHEEGRGITLNKVRFTSSDYDLLGDRAKQHFNRSRYRPEREWLAEGNFPLPEKRMLALSLTNENIAYFENLPFEETIAHLEKLDDDYYRAVPSLEELARLYGNPEGEEFYSARDLYLHYQHRYIREHNLQLHDINDERQHFSRRF